MVLHIYSSTFPPYVSHVMTGHLLFRVCRSLSTSLLVIIIIIIIIITIIIIIITIIIIIIIIIITIIIIIFFIMRPARNFAMFESFNHVLNSRQVFNSTV